MLEFAEDEIIETSSNTMTKVLYTEILDVFETEEYIYIKFGAQTVFILPVRCLDNKDAILEILRTKIPEKFDVEKRKECSLQIKNQFNLKRFFMQTRGSAKNAFPLTAC